MKLLSIRLAIVLASTQSIAGAAFTIPMPHFDSTTVWSEKGATFPAIASNNRDYLVAWSAAQPTKGGLLMAARLNNDGSVRQRFVIAEELPDSGPAVAASRGHYMVVWRKGPGIYQRIITADGELRPVRTIVPDWAEGRVTIAGNKTGIEVAWVERVPQQDFTSIQVAEFDEDLDLRAQSAATDDSLRAGVTITDWPAMAASPRNFLLVWNESGIDPVRRRKSLRCNTHRINGGENGRATAIAGRTRIESEQQSPVVAWNSDYYLAAWTDYRPSLGQGDIFAATLYRGGSVRSIHRIATGRNAQRHPAVAPMARGFLLTWSEVSSSGPTALRGKYFAPDPANNVSASPSTFWSDLGEGGYAVTASCSRDSAIAIAQMRAQGGENTLSAIRVELSR